jgi:hypothetical protein
VARDLAVRWDRTHPQIGVNPDVCLIEPAPPEGDEIESLCAWKPGHRVPRFALEIVSKNHPYKDYNEAPDKYAACGTEELAVFDPLLAGPVAGGGPHLLQLWRRDPGGAFVRIHAGGGPAWSEVLGAWLHVRDGKAVRITNDEAGLDVWHTREEAARAREEGARARIAELEAELARLRR